MNFKSIALCLIGVWLAGCAKVPPGEPTATASPNTPGQAAAAGDACGLLSIGDVQSVLPDAATAQRDDALVAQGMDGCQWRSASGKAIILEVKLWQFEGPDDTPMENAKSFAMGFADPLRSDALAAIRIDRIAGVGDDAAAIVEKADATKGILTTGSLLVLQRSGKIAAIAVAEFGAHERATALAELTSLGKAIAGRL